MADERFSAEKALAPLKKFQRSTVDYAFKRLFGKTDPVHQFLVADEVGLGKTMVARGIIAKMIEHLWDSTKRIDILYICSNQAIAAQNLNRLNVLDRAELALPTRMTLVPLQLRGQQSLNKNKVNFISLTPSTSFELRSSTGVVQERALLYHLLKDLVSRSRGLYNLLQATALRETWEYEIYNCTLEGIDKRMIQRFRSVVCGDRDLFGELQRICELFKRRREYYPQEMAHPRNSMVAKLRTKLSHACVEMLQPDLIIMDEFQRFSNLLHDDSDAAFLARELFDYTEGDGHAARTLLLSATPYKMLTLSEDVSEEEGDHHKEFLETLKFLYGQEKGPKIATTLDREFQDFRRYLQDLPNSYASAVETRKTIEKRLCRVIARTERISSTDERNSMVDEPSVPVSVKPADLKQASAVSEVATALDAPGIIEYWKSSPYLLNFMQNYELKRRLLAQAEDPSATLCDAIRKARPAMLSRRAINKYTPLEPANGRMRVIMDDVFGQRLEQNLWIPAAMPYYGDQQSGPPLTKALIFSAWSMVPEAIAALLSYEAERRMRGGTSGQSYFRQRRQRPLQFRRSKNGQPANLRSLLLIYPSPTLAELADPLAVFAEMDSIPSKRAMRAEIRKRLKSALHVLRNSLAQETAERTEWAAPAMIDTLLDKRSFVWLHAGGMRTLASMDDKAFHEHIDKMVSTVLSFKISGSITDISNLFIDVALGSPAVCALRALKRVAPELAWDDPALLSAAAKVAWSFRTLFNQHDAISLLRKGKGGDDHYWHRVMTYCADHNLQAVLDEYAHYLVEAEGLSVRSPEQRVEGVSEAMATALAILPSRINIDDFRVKGRSLEIKPKIPMRGRFAMQLAESTNEEGGINRIGNVRNAFNSPFRPFVLATTSIGQEGLDFHPYCYRIYHWNLPRNPVDLEQREGRVHRYKGHAVRLNVAARQAATVRDCSQSLDDPWRLMFERAHSEEADDTDLIPYWIYEGPVKVERHVPNLPYSREMARLHWLKKSLTIYRLTFGQPRQDDLLEYLQGLDSEELELTKIDDLLIQLRPKFG